ncbi:MAG: hypothetical protein ABUS79_08820, partial [Pseudomonadota bacterium]
MRGWGRWRIGLVLALLATVVRVAWALAVPTVPVGDFATYRESAMYLAERGHLDSGFVYMPAWVWLLSLVHHLGGEVRASKVMGAVFGGLAAGPLFAVTARLMDNGRAAAHGQFSVERTRGVEDRGRGFGGDVDLDAAAVAVAVTAALAYALWPAGVALASVVGTDIPAAAVMVAALAFLCGWGDRRPSLAAAAFGAAMGVAAYFRAVALPLTALSAVYWMVRRVGARAVVTRTAIAVAMTVVCLLPWGWRNQRQNGEFFLTDSHGGITAMMGNYPNSEGTHARALASLFQDLTGRTLLMQPHRQTDHAAYAIAKQWMGFDPAWTAGMMALRTERLFALEHELLYWSVYRPGVLPPAAAAWFNQHRPSVTAVTDLFYWLFAAGLVAGVAGAWAERRWMLFLPVVFAAMLAATYALFVAEPRYRLSTEVLLFPVAGFGAVRLGGLARRAAQRVVTPWAARGRGRGGVGGAAGGADIVGKREGRAA